jgi:hypothetical protein
LPARRLEARLLRGYRLETRLLREHRLAARLLRGHRLQGSRPNLLNHPLHWARRWAPAAGRPTRPAVSCRCRITQVDGAEFFSQVDELRNRLRAACGEGPCPSITPTLGDEVNENGDECIVLRWSPRYPDEVGRNGTITFTLARPCSRLEGPTTTTDNPTSTTEADLVVAPTTTTTTTTTTKPTTTTNPKPKLAPTTTTKPKLRNAPSTTKTKQASTTTTPKSSTKSKSTTTTTKSTTTTKTKTTTTTTPPADDAPGAGGSDGGR